MFYPSNYQYQKDREEIEKEEALLEKLRNDSKEAELKANNLKASFEHLCGIFVIDHSF